MPDFGPNQHMELEALRVESLIEEVSIDELKKLVPNVNIFTANEVNLINDTISSFQLHLDALFSAYFQDLEYEFPKGEKNILADVSYLRWLSEYIKETTKEQQANYHYFSFVRDYSYCGPKKLIGLKESRLTLSLFDYTSVNCRVYRIDKICVGAASRAFEWAQARIYVTNKFTNEARTEVNNMVTNLRTSFKSLLGRNEWIDDNTKV